MGVRNAAGYGKTVAVLLEANRAAGAYTIDWNAAALASGTYAVRLRVDGIDRAVSRLLRE
ncbi:MAG: hypothetical protein P8M07_04110 [Flavobacteriales bacterium]|nr:hypothetical protein [Flavobacteriales bacterium]